MSHAHKYLKNRWNVLEIALCLESANLKYSVKMPDFYDYFQINSEIKISIEKNPSVLTRRNLSLETISKIDDRTKMSVSKVN